MCKCKKINWEDMEVIVSIANRFVTLMSFNGYCLSYRVWKGSANSEVYGQFTELTCLLQIVMKIARSRHLGT